MKKNYNVPLQFIRSLIFVIFSQVFTVFYSFICMASYPFSMQCRYNVVMGWTRMMVWSIQYLCGVKYEVEGLHHIPKDRVGIVLSKHQSTWETFYLPTVFNLCAIILKRELLWVPFFGWGLGALSPISINRQARSSAMAQIISKGKKCLQKGRWILIFPEGTRIPYGEVGKYKLGGARLAVETGYPVLPVAHNAGRYWPKRKIMKYPGTIKVVFGPLIETEGLTPDEVMAKTQEWIETTIKHL